MKSRVGGHESPALMKFAFNREPFLRLYSSLVNNESSFLRWQHANWGDDWQGTDDRIRKKFNKCGAGDRALWLNCSLQDAHWSYRRPLMRHPGCRRSPEAALSSTRLLLTSYSGDHQEKGSMWDSVLPSFWLCMSGDWRSFSGSMDITTRWQNQIKWLLHFKNLLCSQLL